MDAYRDDSIETVPFSSYCSFLKQVIHLIEDYMSNEILQGNAKIAEFMEVGIIPATSETLPRNQISQEFKTFAECQIYCDEINNRRKFREEMDGRTYIPIHPWGEMEYHKSWDWLMPVVEKIESLFKESLIFIIKANKCYIEMDTQLTMAYDDLPDVPECYSGHCESKIKAAFSTVLQFIDWYTLNVTPS